MNHLPPRGGVGQQQEGGQVGIVGGLENQTAGNETIGGLRAAWKRNRRSITNSRK